MGTNGTNDDDLFDDLADSFFRQGEEGFDDDLWADEPEQVAPAAPEPEPEPEPEPAVQAQPEPVAPPVAVPPPPAPEPVAAAPAPPPAVPEPAPAPPVSSPPTPPPAAPPPSEALPSPAQSPADRRIFSAPTVILPASQPVYTDEDDSEDITTVSASPPVPPPVEPIHEETLFDADVEANFFGDLDDPVGGEETMEVFDAPTQEASRELIQAMLDAPTLDTSSTSEAAGFADQPFEEEFFDDDGLEASADDFVDMLGPDPSLILRRSPAAAPEPEASDLSQSDEETEPAVVDQPAVAAADVAAADVLAPIPPPPSVPEPPAVPHVPVAPEDAPEPATEEAAPEAVSTAPEPIPPAATDAPLVMDTAVGESIDGAPAAPVSSGPALGATFGVLGLRPPASSDAGWAEVQARLEGLAERTEGDESASYAAEAGRIAIEHLGDAERASQLLARAVGAGVDRPSVLAAYSMAVGSLQDHPRLRDLLVRRAEAREGVGQADLLQDAALVERHQLSREQGAVLLLERSLAATDAPGAQWFGLQLLRDTHAAAGRWDAVSAVMEQMASLAEGGEAAPIWMELAAIREEYLDDREGALSAYLGAVAAGSQDPQAIVGAERCASRSGNPHALITLFGQLAERTSGVDAGLWLVRQARACANAGEADSAAEAQARAAELGVPSTLRLEGYAHLADQGRWSELHAALIAESTRADGPGAAWARGWAAEIAEQHLQDATLTVDDLRAVLAADPSSPSAREGLVRALLAAGQSDEALAALDRSLEQATDPNDLLSLHFRLAELREHVTGDAVAARAHYEQTLGISPAYLPALDGLERCAAVAGDWATVVSVHEQRALLREHTDPSASHLVSAGWLAETRAGDSERALGFFERALKVSPTDPVALAGVVRVAGELGLHARVAAALEAAAEATDDEILGVSLLYRLARVQEALLDDAVGARATLAKCVARSPAFRPAAMALAGVARRSGSWSDVVDLETAAADLARSAGERADRLLAAARAARRSGDVREPELIQAVLRIDRNHAAARAEADLRAIHTGDLAVRRTLLHDTASQSQDAALHAVLADICAAMGDRDGAAQALAASIAAGGGSSLPSTLTTIAVRLGDWDTAVELAEAAGNWQVSGTLHHVRRADTQAAAGAWSKLSGDPIAAAGLAKIAASTGDREALAAAHHAVARTAQTDGLRAVHAVLAGRLHSAAGRSDEAVAAYRLGLSEPAVRGRVAGGLLRTLVVLNDADGVGSLLDAVGTDWPTERAELLAEAGDHQGAADAYRAVLGGGEQSPAEQVALYARTERALTEAGDWQGVMDCLRAQAELVSDAATREELGARQRWILAEKLADTDDAWEQYQKLHQMDPDNAEVLEALARIAGARGLTEQAIDYLDHLSRIAPDNVTAARYRRRAAEVHRLAGDEEKARAELSKAIELNPDDTESLSVLRGLAEEQEDWNAVVGVLAREASVMEGADRTDRLRTMARTWEERLAEPAVAMDAWRKVLDSEPGDAESLDCLVALSRKMEDWPTFGEVASARMEQLDGHDRATLQAELGVVLLRHLYREDDAVRHLDSASQGEFAQLAAAEELERIYSGAGIWDKAVDALMRQAACTEGEDRTQRLLRAAQTCLDMTGQRETVSDIYAKVLETDENNLTALRFQADHLYSTGDLERAVEVFLRLEPDLDDFDVDDEDEDDVIEMALSLFRFAQALEKLGRTEEAIQRYEAVREINPAHLPSLEAVGPLYMAAGLWKKASKVYRQILRLTGGQGDPARLARTYTSLGRVEIELGNLDKAERRFAKALQVRPNDISALTGSADVLLKRGDTQSGEQQTDTWRRLLTVYNNVIYHAQTPEEVVYAYLTKGFVLDARLGLADKAAQHYRKSLAFDGAQPGVLLRLAEHALRRQDWPEAESLASQGLALDNLESEQRAGLHLIRYCAFAVCGDSQAAQSEYSAALATGEALATDLGTEGPGASAVHQAVRERLRARL